MNYTLDTVASVMAHVKSGRLVMRSEQERYATIIRTAGIKIEN